jgi:exopolyphosphatase/guanosine-5'-triphosphate,3'-diphosphate pyrophosphatase
MAYIRRAVIDVGTNSIKLLVADVCGSDVRPIVEQSKQTRLGEGFYDTHRLRTEPIAYSANAVADFAKIARAHAAESVRVIATSAARDAVNADELVSAIEAASRLKVEIISGDQEAEWAFQGVTTDPRLANEPLLLLDVGGGSTEFIVGQDSHKQFAHSFPLGTVRLMEKIPHSDPPRPDELAACTDWIRNFLRREVRPRLEPALRPGNESPNPARARQLVGTGGTASILARLELQLDQFDRDRIDAARLSLNGVTGHVQQLWSMPLERRAKIPGLPPKRADVILTGTVIYQAVMTEFGFSELRVSTRGLRFAAVR